MNHPWQRKLGEKRLVKRKKITIGRDRHHGPNALVAHAWVSHNTIQKTKKMEYLRDNNCSLHIESGTMIMSPTDSAAENVEGSIIASHKVLQEDRQKKYSSKPLGAVHPSFAKQAKSIEKKETTTKTETTKTHTRRQPVLRLCFFAHQRPIATQSVAKHISTTLRGAHLTQSSQLMIECSIG